MACAAAPETQALLGAPYSERHERCARGAILRSSQLYVCGREHSVGRERIGVCYRVRRAFPAIGGDIVRIEPNTSRQERRITGHATHNRAEPRIGVAATSFSQAGTVGRPTERMHFPSVGPRRLWRHCQVLAPAKIFRTQWNVLGPKRNPK